MPAPLPLITGISCARTAWMTSTDTTSSTTMMTMTMRRVVSRRAMKEHARTTEKISKKDSFIRRAYPGMLTSARRDLARGPERNDPGYWKVARPRRQYAEPRPHNTTSAPPALLVTSLPVEQLPTTYLPTSLPTHLLTYRDHRCPNSSRGMTHGSRAITTRMMLTIYVHR